MRRLIHRLERRLVAAYEFWQNCWHYIGRGHPPRTAWHMARNTL
jgi:hypothetical protein